MELETAEILKQFGFDPEKVTDAESFKKQFNETYISREVAVDDPDIKNRVMGKRIGGIHTKTKRIFTDLGVEFTSDELKDIKVEGLMDLGIGKLNDVLKLKETELKSTFESTKDETVIKLNGQIETFEKRVTELNELNTSNVNKLTEANENFAGEMQVFKMDSLKKDAKSRVTFIDTVSAFEKAGFDSIIKNDFSFKFTENEEVEITGSDGKRVMNESDNKFATMDEVYVSVAKKGNIFKQNNSGGSNLKANLFANGTGSNGAGNGNGKGVEIALHPNALTE